MPPNWLFVWSIWFGFYRSIMPNPTLPLSPHVRELAQTEEADDLDALRVFIYKNINYYLSNNLEHLMQIFYRLDLAEEKVRAVFFDETIKDVAEALTNLVLEREKRRREIWEKYSDM